MISRREKRVRMLRKRRWKDKNHPRLIPRLKTKLSDYSKTELREMPLDKYHKLLGAALVAGLNQPD